MTTRNRLIAGCLAATAALAPVALAVGKPPPPASSGATKNVNACETGVKIEPVVDGTYARTLNGVPVSITLAVDEAAQSYDFSASAPVTSARSKGGTGFLTRTYAAGATSDTGLHAPLNPRSGKVYGLSHVCFFSDLPPVIDPPEFLVPPVEEPVEPPVEEPVEPPVEEEPPPVFSY